MNILRLTPLFISFLLIAAHFQRAEATLLTVASLLAPGLLFVTRPWSARILQILLLLIAIEWSITLTHLVQQRQELGQPWIRLAVILFTVILFTCCSTLVFQFKSVRKRYGL